jgi:hypothetical protein
MNDWIPLVLHENQVCFLIELDRFSFSSFHHQKKKIKQLVEEAGFRTIEIFPE